MNTAWSSMRPSGLSAHRPRRRCRSGRPATTGRSVRFGPRFELVEDRTLLSTFLVESTVDAGPGSLRQAILDANATSGGDVIDFAIPGDGVHTIAPSRVGRPTHPQSHLKTTR